MEVCNYEWSPYTHSTFITYCFLFIILYISIVFRVQWTVREVLSLSVFLSLLVSAAVPWGSAIMDFQHRAGGKTGSGGVASSSESNRDRRERLRQLALETIDINKDPYFMKNHLGSYECKLCLTLHNNEVRPTLMRFVNLNVFCSPFKCELRVIFLF